MADFEKSITELEKIVAGLEKGDMSLDDMLTLFEKGIKISRECNKTLDAAEKKVSVLLKNEQGDIEQVAFEVE